MDALNITDTLKSIQAVINSQPGLNVDDPGKTNKEIVDNRLNIIKQKVDRFEDKNDFFYSLLIKLIAINLGEIYNREFRNWIGLVLDENCKLIPQRTDIIYSYSNISDTIDKIEQADRDFSIKLFEYVCDILENNKDIMLDIETLNCLLNRDPKLSSLSMEGHYYYRSYNFSRLAKIIKENQTLEKTNISLDDVYQILIQTFQLNNEDVFGNLVKPEEFKKNHEAVNLALLDCYAYVFVEITNIIKKCLDKNFDRLAIVKLRNYDNFCEKECPIGAIRVAKSKEDYNKIQKEIDDDPRATKDLFVDRYGAVAISDFFKIELDDIKEKSEKDCITIIEVYNPDIAECLLKSIPIKDLTKNLPKDTLYYKTESDKNIDEYEMKELPSLLIFKNSKLLGHIDGYYTIDDKEVVLSKLDDILKNN